MNRRKACETQVMLCLTRARADHSLRDFWGREALKWQRRADEETGRVALYEIRDGRILAVPSLWHESRARDV